MKNEVSHNPEEMKPIPPVPGSQAASTWEKSDADDDARHAPPLWTTLHEQRGTKNSARVIVSDTRLIYPSPAVPAGAEETFSPRLRITYYAHPQTYCFRCVGDSLEACHSRHAAGAASLSYVAVPDPVAKAEFPPSGVVQKTRY